MLILFVSLAVVLAGLVLGFALWLEARTRSRDMRADDWLAEGGLRR